MNRTGFTGERKARKVSHDQREPREPFFDRGTCARCAWFWRTERITNRGRRRSFPIAEKFGCSSATLRGCINRQAIKDDDRDDLTQSAREKFKALRWENRELKQANENLRKGEAFV